MAFVLGAERITEASASESTSHSSFCIVEASVVETSALDALLDCPGSCAEAEAAVPSVPCIFIVHSQLASHLILTE